uniref:Uncharacterized protein n=1 Tax=Quercus lobata TaxID=97700 RepID=A0A7N2LPS2_QUELO
MIWSLFSRSIMLQSLVPQSPVSNMNPKHVDHDDSSGDETTTTTKCRNLSNEASVSGKKALVKELHHDENESSASPWKILTMPPISSSKSPISPLPTLLRRKE